MAFSSLFRTSTKIAHHKTDNPKGSLFIPKDADVLEMANSGIKLNGRPVQYAKAQTGDIFAVKPTLADIKPGKNTNDGFLLCAVIEILRNGQDIIEDMMRDEGETVTVRIFNKEGKPSYINVDKAFPEGKLSEGALWVKILEKAYAAYYGDYERLNGGCVDQAVNVLTGAKKEDECFLPRRGKLSGLTDFLFAPGLYRFNELMRLSEKTPETIRNAICKEVFKDQRTYFDLWQSWLSEKAESWQKLIKKHPIHVQDVKEFFAKYRPNKTEQSILRFILEWVEENKILPGAAGEYSYDELAMFQKMQECLENKAPVFATSKSEKSTKLHPRLSYAVVEFQEEKNKKYVLLRNTYGVENPSFGMKIAYGEKNAPLVRLELHEFFDSLAELVNTESVSVQAMQERAKNAVESRHRSSPSG